MRKFKITFITFLIGVLLPVYVFAASMVYYPDPAVADQGATASSRSIASILAAIGTTNLAVIELSDTKTAGTVYTIGQSVNWSAYINNVTLRVMPGAYFSHGAYTMSMMKIDAGFHQIFSGTGAVTYPGKKYPEWFGAKDDSGTTDNLNPINYALRGGGAVELVAPTGGYYKITDVLTMGVAGTRLFSNSNAEIRQATSNKGGINITASNCSVKGVKLQGPQHATVQTSEKAIYVYGADSSAYISNIEISENIITNWGYAGIWSQFVSDFNYEDNDISSIHYTGISTLSSEDGTININRVNDMPGSAATSWNAYGIALTRGNHYSLAADGTGLPRSKRIVVSNNVIWDIPTWECTDTHGAEGIAYINNSLYACDRGIMIGTSSNGTTDVFPSLNISVNGNVIDSGQTNGSANYGIVFSGLASATLTGTADPTASTALVGSGTTFTTELGEENVITINGETRTVVTITDNTHLTVDLAFTDTAAASITRETAASTGSVAGNSIINYGDEDSATGNAVFLFATEGLSLSGNNIINPGTIGIFITGENRGLSISGGSIIDPWTSRAATGEAVGIKVASTNNEVVISGVNFGRGIKSTVRGDSTATYLRSSGIRVNGDSTNKVKLSSNLFLGYTNNIVESGTGSVSQGTFTLGAAATTVVTNYNVGIASKIHLTPTNAAAATLMGSAKSLYISARTAETSFTVATADAGNAGGTETFYYTIE